MFHTTFRLAQLIEPEILLCIQSQVVIVPKADFSFEGHEVFLQTSQNVGFKIVDRTNK